MGRKSSSFHKMSRKMKAIIFIAVIAVLTFAFSTYKFSLTYFYLCCTLPKESIDDYKIFQSVPIKTGDSVFYYDRDLKRQQAFLSAFPSIEYPYKGDLKNGSLDELFSDTKTTAFIIIKDNDIYYERYGNGYSKEFSGTSFSVAKSFISALTGIAIHEGYFQMDDPMHKYIPELKGEGFEKVTIKDLLSMSSGIRFTKSDDYLILHHMADESLHLRYPDLKKLLLSAKISEPAQQHFQYNDYNTMFLTMIIERTTGMLITEYMQKKLWEPMGMEYSATWTTDNNGFVKSAHGLNASAIDFAKLGSLYLNNGFFNGEQIIPADWVMESVRSEASLKNKTGYYPDWINENDFYYGYQWWGNSKLDSNNHFFAWGALGQYIYVIPEKNILFVRQGKEYGLDHEHSSWPNIFESIAEKSDIWTD